MAIALESQRAAEIEAKRVVSGGIEGDFQRGQRQNVALPAADFAAQGAQFAQRALIEFAVHPLQFAQAGHLVDPAVGPRRLAHLLAVRYAHPANQQPTAVGCLHGLRGIELKPGIQLVQLAVREGGAGVIEAAGHPHRRIGVEVARFLAGNPLRAANQNMLVAKREQVRTLPHITGIVQSVDAGAGDFALARPLMEICGAEQQHLAALLPILRTQHHVPAAFMLPDFRVAHVAGIALWQRQDRAGFAEGAVGIFRRQALPGGPAAVCKFDVTGVAQGQRPVVIHRAA